MSESTPSALAAKRRKYKLVVSDFHLGKGRYFSDGTQNILEDFVYDREFSEFLLYHRSGEYQDADVELILNGDILNLLQIDYYGVHTHLFSERSQIHAVRKIVAGHPDFFLALRRWVSTTGHTISYVVGNHDVGMLFKGAQKVFAEACGGEVRFFDVAHVFDGIHVEHGQQYERFAKTNMDRPFITRGVPEPVIDLPWGSLFVAVLLPKIKQTRPHIDKVRPFRDFIVWAIIHDFWWTIRTFLMCVVFTFETLIFKTRYQFRKGVRAQFDLLKEVTLYPSYDRIAFRILDEHPDVNVVVFGHTHILRYRQYREGKEYFNEGSWNEVTNLDLSEYGTRTRLTYGFIEYPLSSSDAPVRPQVRLKEWKGVWRPEMDIQV